MMNRRPNLVKNMNKVSKSVLGICCLMGLVFSACDDANRFYEKLDFQPEIFPDASAYSVYSVGDTMLVKGRLHPENNLEIHVGDTKAEIIRTYVDTVAYSNDKYIVDVAQVLITQEMGIGRDRPVSLTSGGETIRLNPIEIVGDANKGILEHQLELVKIADFPANSILIPCYSGSGSIYLWNENVRKLSKSLPNGSLAPLFDGTACTDASGTFAVTEFFAGAVSPDDRYFYFNARVTETGQSASLYVYKLCRYDLQTRELTTLNRTEYYAAVNSKKTIEYMKPFEGNIGEVKIHKLTAIYPDSKGNLYCDVQGHFLTRLDARGDYRYLFDISEKISSVNPETDKFYPNIYQSDEKRWLGISEVHQYYPGIITRYPPSLIDAEAGIMYQMIVNGNLELTDLRTLTPIASYENRLMGKEPPYATASLASFNGGLAGYVKPLPVNGKLLGLYFLLAYPDTENDYSAPLYDQKQLPAFCEIDFGEEQSLRYAPKRLLFNGFKIHQRKDRLINYDAEGMVYMTMNSGSVIVKTRFVQ